MIFQSETQTPNQLHILLSLVSFQSFTFKLLITKPLFLSYLFALILVIYLFIPLLSISVLLVITRIQTFKKLYIIIYFNLLSRTKTTQSWFKLIWFGFAYKNFKNQNKSNKSTQLNLILIYTLLIVFSKKTCEAHRTFDEGPKARYRDDNEI